MGTASARTRISGIFLCLCVHAWGGWARSCSCACVRAVTVTSGASRRGEAEGQRVPREATPEREREARTAKEGRESPRSDEEVIESHPRSRIPLLKFDSTSSSCGESSMSGKTKGKEDKDHATKGQ